MTTTYKGFRYVPKVMGEWDQTISYEGLSIVVNKGDSYTSKKRVPENIPLTNEEFWTKTGSLNAQITNLEQSTTAQFQQTEALVSKNSFFNTNDMRLLAHRGFSSIAPENSLPACELAGEYGYWGVEFDVFFTTDNVPVIIHDDTVDRTTNGVGKIEEMTFSQVQALKIDFGEKIEMYENLKVPTLVEYLETSKKHNIIPIIEIKQGSSTNANLDKMIEIIKKHGFEENCIVISFYKEHLTYVRSVNKKITLAPLIPITTENIEFVLSLGNSLIDPYSPTLTKELIDQCHSKGIKVITWTVDDITEKNRLMKLGVDFLTTNSLVEGV